MVLNAHDRCLPLYVVIKMYKTNHVDKVKTNKNAARTHKTKARLYTKRLRSEPKRQGQTRIE